jgi:hypothetical protein
MPAGPEKLTDEGEKSRSTVLRRASAAELPLLAHLDVSELGAARRRRRVHLPGARQAGALPSIQDFAALKPGIPTLCMRSALVAGRRPSLRHSRYARAAERTRIGQSRGRCWR